MRIPMNDEEQPLSITQNMQKHQENGEQPTTIERSIHTITIRNHVLAHRTLVDSPFRRIYEASRSHDQERTIEPNRDASEEEKKIDREAHNEKYSTIENLLIEEKHNASIRNKENPHDEECKQNSDSTER